MSRPRDTQIGPVVIALAISAFVMGALAARFYNVGPVDHLRVMIAGGAAVVFGGCALAPWGFRTARSAWNGGPARLVDRVVLRRRIGAIAIALVIPVATLTLLGATRRLGATAGWTSFGAVLMLGATLKLGAWRMEASLRCRLRAARGALCPGCGYALNAIIGGTCPECGEWTFPDSARQAWHEAIGPWTSRRR